MLITLISVFCLYALCYYLSATLLLLILLGTSILVIRENNLRRTEIHRKTQTILEEISLAKILCKNWTAENYPNLCCPLSPCVTLQWTYRDGIIVNLPWALLVRGDHIIIRPGQVAPGQCTEINNRHTFHCGETYGLFQVKMRHSVVNHFSQFLLVSANRSSFKTNSSGSSTRSCVYNGSYAVPRYFKNVF